MVQSHWGLCTIDCFASGQNFKTTLFYSKYYYPNSSGVDGFAFSWSGEMCWLVTSICLVPKAIRHVCSSNCRAILTVPFWPSSAAYFWPFIVNSSGHFRPFVFDYIWIETGKDVFEHGPNTFSLFASEEFYIPVLLLLLDGALS